MEEWNMKTKPYKVSLSFWEIKDLTDVLSFAIARKDEGGESDKTVKGYNDLLLKIRSALDRDE
jgi:ssRNA-specific RNase YbeY (16S rRNA maturation enzyme)